MPPQSPVAWSNFITGLDAGGHGIFDFVHRDPKTMIPYLSTSRAEASDRTLKLGKYQIPLGSDKVELLRHGQPFWEVLEKRGIHTTIIRMPANFPPSGTRHRASCRGWARPTSSGTYGTFSYYTTDPFTLGRQGRLGRQGLRRGVRARAWPRARSTGPPTRSSWTAPKIAAPFTVYVDADEPVAKLVVGSEERVLKVGEWTDWVPISLDLVPTQSGARHRALLPEGGPARLRALRHPAEPRPA